MRKATALLLTAIALLAVGCGIADPGASVNPIDEAPQETEGSTNTLQAFTGKGGQRTPEAAARKYAALLESLPDSANAATTRSMLQLVSREQAPVTLRLVDQAIAQNGAQENIKRYQLVALSMQNAAGTPFAYAILREGIYNAAGGLTGASRLRVYSVAFSRARAGWIIDKWQPAQ